MISEVKEIAVTEISVPFASAYEFCDLESYGYEEKEYFFSGTSNVYTRSEDGAIRIRSKEAPYVNRLLIRRPKDPKKFSGNVMLEILNPSSNMDIDRMWIEGYPKLMRDGDVWAGFTSKPNTLKVLKTYDEKRYGELCWDNPTKEQRLPGLDILKRLERELEEEEDENREGVVSPKQLVVSGLKDLNQTYETGLVWDMLRDLPGVLRDQEKGPLKGYEIEALVLAGWSQTADFVRTYVRYFAYTRPGGDCYDGYMPAGGVCYRYTPLCQYDLDERMIPSEKIRYCPVPVMALQTGNDATRAGNFERRMEDSDAPDFQYRSYEFAGGSHNTMYNFVNYYKDSVNIHRISHLLYGGMPAYTGSHAYGNDYPQQFLFRAAYRNMFQWIRTKTAPGHAPKIQNDSSGRQLRDGFGNSIGGVRTCMINYPTAHYCGSDTVEKNGEPFVFNSDIQVSMFGHERPFSAELLKELYGDIETYRKLCEMDTRISVSQGFVLAEDAEELVELAVKKAKERGL